MRRAAAKAAADLERALDVDVNGALFCDASGPVLDQTGEEAGFVPVTKPALACGTKLASAVATLASERRKCLLNSAIRAFRDRPSDEATCQSKAQRHYEQSAAKAIARGGCPACLVSAARAALSQETKAVLDAERGNVLPCLGGYFFQLGGGLEATAPTTLTPQREVARRLDPDETGAFRRSRASPSSPTPSSIRRASPFSTSPPTNP